MNLAIATNPVQRTLHGLLLALGLAAAGLGPVPARGAGETWLLTNLRLGSDYPLESVQLREAGSDRRYTVRVKQKQRGRNFEMRKVQPGDYHVSSVNTFYYNMLPAEFSEPARLAEIPPVGITYIGDIVVSGIKQEDRGYSTRFEFRFNGATLRDAVRQREGDFVRGPVYLAMPGMDALPFDAVALVNEISPAPASTPAKAPGLFQLPGQMWWLRARADGSVRACWITPDRTLALNGRMEETGRVTWSEPTYADQLSWSGQHYLFSSGGSESVLEPVADDMDARCVIGLYGV